MNIAIVAGSNRLHSASTRFARYIGSRLGAKGHSIAWFDLREHPLPLYDPDSDEEPPSVNELVRTVGGSDAIVLATPEYHGSLSGVLKNALDYLDREHFDGKAVLSVSAAGGAVGVSSLAHLQTIVRNLHGVNCPDWISAGGEQRRFEDNGIPADARMRDRVEKTLNDFVRMASMLRAKDSH